MTKKELEELIKQGQKIEIEENDLILDFDKVFFEQKRVKKRSFLTIGFLGYLDESKTLIVMKSESFLNNEGLQINEDKPIEAYTL